MLFRQATSDDARAIATIHVRSWQHAYADILPPVQLAALSIDERAQQWVQRFRSPNPPHVLVAIHDGAVVGFAGWGKSTEKDASPGEVTLASLYLLPEYVGRGIGSALIDAAEAEMIASGAHEGTLHVLVDNVPTRTFYERKGWCAEPGTVMIEHFFGIDVTTIRYRKHLAP